MIGFTGLLDVSFKAHFTPAVEIGWRLASKYWYRGLATEAAKAVLALAFSKFELPEVVSFTAKANKPSRRVMEKIGMHHNFSDDFEFPTLDKADPLCHHVLYKISRKTYAKQISG